MSTAIQPLLQQRSELHAEVERLLQERGELRAQLERLLAERGGLPTETERLREECAALRAHGERLRAALLVAQQWIPESPISPIAAEDLRIVNEALGSVPQTSEQQ